MSDRTPAQEKGALTLAAICGVVLTAGFVVLLLASRGGVSW